MLKCVVFVYFRKDGKLVPAGTAFFAGRSAAVEGRPVVGVTMTANHVITGIRAHGDDLHVLLRIDTFDGKSGWHDSLVSDWLQPDPNTDLAFLPWVPPIDSEFNVGVFQINSFASLSELRDGSDIGIGDEVITVGLFRNHVGGEHNEPVIRVGNISSIPREKITSERFGQMRAILIETRSIGGLSGSPVYLHRGWRDEAQTVIGGASRKPTFTFLGIMHGHWDTDSSAADVVNENTGEPRAFHTGIGIVIPAEDVVAALDAEIRRQIEQE